MGYNFLIGVLKSGDVQSDLSALDNIDETTIVMELDEDKLNHRLAQFPGISGDSGDWHWDVPEGGTLDISVNSPLLHIDTHAEWLAVLEIYLHIYSIEPRAFLIDSQTVIFHNERSFRDFIVAPHQGVPNLEGDYNLDQLNQLVDELISGDRIKGLDLFRLNEKAAPIQQRLVNHLGDVSHTAQLDSINALGKMGKMAANSIPALVDFAQKSGDTIINRYTYIALGEIATPNPKAISFLVDSLQHVEIGDYANILKALLKMQRDDFVFPLLIEKMQALYSNNECNWATAFADMFFYLNNYQIAKTELTSLLQHQDPMLRLLAAMATDALVKRHHCCEDLVDMALSDSWERVRRIATTSLSRLPRSKGILKKLQTGTHDDDDEVRARALWAIDFGTIN